MVGRLEARPASWQSMPLSVWPLIGLALLAVAARLGESFSPLPAVTLAAPFLLAAAIVYIEPLDRRFLYGALMIAANQAIILGSSFVDGALAFYVPVLLTIADFLRIAVPLLMIGGLVLFGIALGGVRIRSGKRATLGLAAMAV